MLKQRTIKSVVKTVGIGLHSGRKVTLTLRPAAPGNGIIFTRVDLDPAVEIPATASAIGDTRLASVLQKDGTRVSTVEHLMSACAGLGIDNLYVDVDAEEIPIMDGSAASFVFLLQSAGIEEQGAAKRFIRVIKPVEVRDGDKLARLEPYFGFKLSFTIEFRHPAVDKTGRRSRSISPTPATPARSPVRAPSALPTKSRCCGRSGWRAAAAWTTPSCSMSTAC